MSENPLVAAEQDSTQWYTGIGIVESINDLVQGIESGNWVDIGLGALTTGLEALSLVMDPIGSVGSNLVSFVIEHVRPLQDALDRLAGNADAVAAQAQTWQNVADAVRQEQTQYQREANTDTSAWHGAAADAYRRKAAETVDLLGGGVRAAEGLAGAVKLAGMVVATVRETVRDLIADLVGRLVVWAAEALTVVGAPAAAVQAATAAAKWAARIAQFMKKLLRTMQNLIPLLRKLSDLLRQLRKKLDDLRGGGGGKPPDKPGKRHTGGGGDHTEPSGVPDPNAKPRGKEEQPKPQDDAETKRGLKRQNEAAETLARNGYDVEYLAKVKGQPSPDFKIEGQVFDAYSPKSSSPRNIASNIETKVVEEQTDRVVLNLVDSSASADSMRAQLRDYPIQGLREVKVIDRNGNIVNVYP